MENKRELLLLIGESGSGKSTFARQLVDEQGYVRVNRDDLRIEYSAMGSNLKGGVTGRDYENLIAKAEKDAMILALSLGKNVVLDNTHLNEKTVNRWREFAKQNELNFQIHRMQTPLEICIERDAQRTGKAHVGRAVIERQFVKSKRMEFDPQKPIVLVDLDGTLMDMRGLRGPFEEHKVHLDRCWAKIRNEINRLAQTCTIVIVSGRHSTCGDLSIDSLNGHDVKFAHILMRHAWDNRADYIVKEEILNELLGVINKDQILYVIDDRPQVIEKCWLKNNIPVRPVFQGEFIPMGMWTIKHAPDCSFSEGRKGYGRCPQCGALEDF